MPYAVLFQPDGCRGMAIRGESLLAVARRCGVAIEAPCGGAEGCGKCKVQIVHDGRTGMGNGESRVSPLTEKERRFLSPEEIAQSFRLACAAKVQGDVVVAVPEQSRGGGQIILEFGLEYSFQLKPALKKYYLQLQEPTLEDYRDDVSRLIDELYSAGVSREQRIAVDYRLLCRISPLLRQYGWKTAVTVWEDREIVAIEPAGVTGIFGAAIDIGTTTLAARLYDLETGQVAARDSSMNSQVQYGDDVLSRISYGMMQANGCVALHRLIVADINRLLVRMAKAAGVEPERIQEVVVAGNTVMHHILMNINPQYLGRAPFTSTVRRSLDIKARELGITIGESGNVHFLPIEAGFVGADNVAVLLAEEPYKKRETVLLVDIGTNGEINLGNSEWLLSTSCATGPALEGAQIKWGMRAAEGAIEHVEIEAAWTPQCKIIGGVLPKGICGSGIIDAVAEMLKTGIILPDGGFNKKVQCSRVRKGLDGKMEYVLVWAEESAVNQDIVVTQKDVRAVQLAKAALYAGAKMLMKKRGVVKLDGVVLAGAFGSYINKENALRIGLFPDCDPDCIRVVGNAAGEGAGLALLNVDKRREAAKIAAAVQFVETAAEKDFQACFYEAMQFPQKKNDFSHV